MPESSKYRADAIDLPASEQVRRAIYVDIKGPADDLPVLASFLSPEEGDGSPVQVVTDMAFADAALAKDLRVQQFEDFVEDLITRCQADGRCLFTWGTSLADATDRPAGPSSLGRQLAQVVTDIRPALLATVTVTGKKAGKGREPDLVDLLRQVGLPTPRHLGSKQSAQRLRYVRQQLARHDAYGSITSTAKAKWTKLLQQGQNDCRGLHDLTTSVAMEIPCRHS